jgi:hypothetical protein
MRFPTLRILWIFAAAAGLAACGSADDPDAARRSPTGAAGSPGLIGDGPSGNAGAASAASSGSDASCADLSVTMTRQTPTVLLLIDQSLSMAEPFGSGTRWTVVRDALLSPSSGLVHALEKEIRFGLALYTSLDGSLNGGTCPLLVEVQCAVGNYTAIHDAWNAAAPIDDTPTAESIIAVTAKLEQVTEPGPRHIVLATDGAPDMCEVPDDLSSQQKQQAKDGSVKAAQAAFSKGIRTSVIAIGPGVGTSHLQDLANAGQGLPVGGGQDAKFFEALDQDALTKAFSDVIEGARSCKFTLDGEVVGGAGGSGTVTLDGEALPYGGENGWTLESPTEIELQGDACKKVQSGDHQLSATFPCGAVVIK